MDPNVLAKLNELENKLNKVNTMLQRLIQEHNGHYHGYDGSKIDSDFEYYPKEKEKP